MVVLHFRVGVLHFREVMVHFRAVVVHIGVVVVHLWVADMVHEGWSWHTLGRARCTLGWL